jgi:hypothetical protein
MKPKIPKHKEVERYTYDKERKVLEIDFKPINDTSYIPVEESVMGAVNEAFPQTVGKELRHTFPLIESNRQTFNAAIYIWNTSERILIAIKPKYIK